MIAEGILDDVVIVAFRLLVSVWKGRVAWTLFARRFRQDISLISNLDTIGARSTDMEMPALFAIVRAPRATSLSRTLT